MRKYLIYAKALLEKEGLSHKQTEILELLSKGLSNPEIAKVMKHTEKTIVHYLHKLYKITDTKNRAHLVGLGFRNRYLRVPEDNFNPKEKAY